MVNRDQQASSELALLATLAFIAGLVDVTGWLTFDGFFTSQVTGNLVLAAAGVRGGDPPEIARLLALPVFALALASGYLAVWRPPSRRSLLALLLAQTILLGMVCLVLLLLEHHGPAPGPRLLASMLAVASMGVQAACVRASLHESQSTAVMTSNFITVVIAAVALVHPGPWSRDEARDKLRHTLPIFLAFVAGCPLGAGSVALMGRTWAWVVPLLASVLVFPLARRMQPATPAVPPGSRPGPQGRSI